MTQSDAGAGGVQWQARRHGAAGLLIRGATLRDGRHVDVMIEQGRIRAIGDRIAAGAGAVMDAHGGALLPGLHDHHLHLFATAAALASVRCGPPEVTDEAALARALAVPGSDWLRGVGYHESVAGLIDRRWLDGVAPERPVRVQHRSGRLWIFNSAGLERLRATGVAPPPELDHDSGHLFDADAWLHGALGGTPPALDAVGAALARSGVTGLTDMTPANDAAAAGHLASEQASGALPQRIVVAGLPSLAEAPLAPGLRLGAVKIHLHEARLPGFDHLVTMIRAAHDACRSVAVHCVTAVELTFTLAALRDAGVAPGDRIEHASVGSDELVSQVAALGVAVVVQPNFVAERGDAYRAAFPEAEWPDLYRLRSFRAAGVVLAGGSDAPFGVPDPWAAMAAAVNRRTASGAPLSPAEALQPDEALDLFMADPVALGRCRTIEVGAPADLCLLDRPWTEARQALAADLVRATVIGGRLVYDRELVR